MASWPSDLPQAFEQRGFRSGAKDNVLRSPVSAGPSKSRRRFTAAPKPVRALMTMTGEQVEQFESFLSDDIADGAISFSFPGLRDPTETITVMFNSAPTWVAADGDNYNVSFDLIVLP